MLPLNKYATIYMNSTLVQAIIKYKVGREKYILPLRHSRKTMALKKGSNK
jgi:hypothetical protein